MKIIALANQKGGVAKTTSSFNIGAGFVKAGKKVLLIDLDPQGSLSEWAGVNTAEIKDSDTVLSMLKDKRPAREIILETQLGFDLIPSNIDLAAADITLGQMFSREKKLLHAIKDLTEYDYILIDCPPNLSLVTVNAFTAADKVYIPVQPEALAVKGVKLLLDTIAMIKEDLNEGLEIGGVIITRYKSNLNIMKECLRVLQEQFNDKIFKTMIRENATISESPLFKQCIFDYDPKCNGSKDYGGLVSEILEREEK